MRGKTGAARLWLATGAPVIPVAHVGPGAAVRPAYPEAAARAAHAGHGRGRAADRPDQVGRRDADAAHAAEITEHIMLTLRDMVAEIRGGTPPPLWSLRRRRASTCSDRPAGRHDAARSPGRSEDECSRDPSGRPCSAPVPGAPRSPRCSPTPAARSRCGPAARRSPPASARTGATRTTCPGAVLPDGITATTRPGGGAGRRRPGRARACRRRRCGQPGRLGRRRRDRIRTPPWSA